MTATRPLPGVTPLFIGSENCAAMCGFSFAYALRLAARYGVQVYRLGTRKRVIDAAGFLHAMRQNCVETHPPTPPIGDLTLEQLATALGRELTDGEMRAHVAQSLGVEAVDAGARATTERTWQALQREYCARQSLR